MCVCVCVCVSLYIYMCVCVYISYEASQVALVVKNPPANAGDADSIPGFERAPGGGHDNSLQHSCLENPMDRGAWQAMVHGVTKSQTWLNRLSIAHDIAYTAYMFYIFYKLKCGFQSVTHGCPGILRSFWGSIRWELFLQHRGITCLSDLLAFTLTAQTQWW